jgi:DNA-binding GntR family transcriptional regulator
LAEFNRPVYALIEDMYGQQVQDMQMSVTAVSIPGRLAKQLVCKSQSPGLRVVRRYRGASDALFSVSISTYPNSRFEVSIRYRLDWVGTA